VNKKAILIAVLIVKLVVLVLPAAAKGNTVDVCHRTGNGSYNLIKSAESALSTHLGHGDAAPGSAVPGMAGWVFGANCAPVAADSDGDGVLDTVDACPNAGDQGYGLDANGCPSYQQYQDATVEEQGEFDEEEEGEA
jgi:hypothetical protein